MDLVVDATGVFATLIKDGKSAEILLNFSRNFFIPEFIMEEFENHKIEIISKTHRDEADFWDTLRKIKETITIVKKDELKDFLDEAEKISPDTDDVMYFALALKLKCGIWSNDKRLREQNKVKIYSTEDLVKEFEL